MSDVKTQTADTRIRSVAREAEDAFWAKLAEVTHEATSGNMPPDIATTFAKQCHAAAEIWYDLNVPQINADHFAKGCARVGICVLMRPPRMRERGFWVHARTPAAALAEILRESEDLGWKATHDYDDRVDEHGMICVTIQIGGIE